MRKIFLSLLAFLMALELSACSSLHFPWQENTFQSPISSVRASSHYRGSYVAKGAMPNNPSTLKNDGITIQNLMA